MNNQPKTMTRRNLLKQATLLLLASPLMPAMPPIPTAKSTGGPVEGGTTYLIGDSGPELFTPRRLIGWDVQIFFGYEGENARPVRINSTPLSEELAGDKIVEITLTATDQASLEVRRWMERSFILSWSGTADNVG